MMLVFLLLRFFEIPFQIAQHLKVIALIFGNPTLVDLVQGHWIEVMQLLASAPLDGNEIRRLQKHQMFGHCLSRHGEMLTKVPERLPAARAQFIEQLASAGISQGFENFIHVTAHYATIWLHNKLTLTKDWVPPQKVLG